MIGKRAQQSESLPLYVGTSGWSYAHWHGRFYPDDLQEREWLTFYARRFRTVELNVTFYRMPFENMIRGWRTRAPTGFLFAAKGSRVVTHRKRLKGVHRDVSRFLARIRGLGDRLGVILWQLPPSMQRDDKRLERFLKGLPNAFAYAVEFRHPSWYAPAVCDILRESKVAMVDVSSMRMPCHHEVTSDFVYLRFHGLAGGFAHDYTADELAPWAEHAAACLRKGHRVYAYFNNDADARAPANAERFESMVLEQV